MSKGELRSENPGLFDVLQYMLYNSINTVRKGLRFFMHDSMFREHSLKRKDICLSLLIFITALVMSVALIPLPGYAAKSQDKNVSDAGFCSILTKIDQSDYITADSKNESKQVNNLVKTVKADIKKDEAKKRAAKKKKAEEKKKAKVKAAARAAAEADAQGRMEEASAKESKSSGSDSTLSGKTNVKSGTFKNRSKGKAVADFALKFVGNPYVWGGESLTKGADCSGFVLAVYKYFGVSMAHGVVQQSRLGRSVSYRDAKPGDLICYSNHIGIYIGDNKIVHAMNPANGITVSRIGYNGKRITTIRRIFD